MPRRGGGPKQQRQRILELIDNHSRYDPADGLATSIKSMDFRAATYQRTTPFAYRLRIYVGEVSEFVGGKLGKDVVDPSDIKGRALEVVIPTGTMTPKQREIVEAVRIWAKPLRNPVEIIINEK